MDQKAKIILENLKEDLKVYQGFLKDTAKEMIEGGFTEYPIFLAHYFEAKVGETIVDRRELGTHFSIEASTVEEFTDKGLIQPEKVAEFKNKFKNPREFMCLFLITEKGGSYLFFPYSADAEKDINLEA
jgi:hypothetical protein